MITQNPDYLIAIVENGNLTKASEKLFISQPSLSQYIKRLESSLGTELFDRSSSPMKLTYAGERYYDYILQVKQMEINIKEELLHIKQEMRGRIRLGVALWRGACLIPDVFPEYHRRFPEVKLELFEGRFVQMKQALENFEIDLMIANLLPAGNYADVQVEPITRERILLAAPASSAVVQEALKKNNQGGDFPVISLDILDHLPLVVTKKGQALTDMISSMLTRQHITPDVLMETGNLTTAINLTAKGMCCTFVPEEGARICRHPDDVVFFKVDQADLSWDLAFLYRKNSYLGAVKTSFMDCVKEILASSPADAGVCRS